MDIVCEKLMNMRERPVLWIGRLTLGRLRTYISGYYEGIREIDKNFSSDFSGFYDYIAKYYGVKETALNWDGIINSYCADEKEAFNKFYELLDEFLEQQGKKE